MPNRRRTRANDCCECTRLEENLNRVSGSFVSRAVTAIEQSRMVENVFWDLVTDDESLPPSDVAKKKQHDKSLC